MKYSKQQFVRELKDQIDTGYNPVRIAQWAHNEIYLKHSRYLEQGLQELLMQLIAMEEGPEFEISESELRKLADDLIEGRSSSL
jgi:hypothetical protein